MEKIAFIFMVMLLAACNPESSPEGRSKIRDKALKEEIMLLKQQVKEIQDSLKEMKEDLRGLESQP